MSIPILAQVYDEVRRLSIAGSVVAGGDFRVKKLLPQLEQMGEKAPVFAKVAQAASRLVESTEQTSAEALLDLSTLVNAILYTQGETGLAGQLIPIPSINLGQTRTQAAASKLGPLVEALSQSGSGRLEIIKDAHQRGLFLDVRLVRPAVRAIDDTYPEIAEFICENVLPLYGRAIVEELTKQFWVKGKAGDVRRLALLHRLDPSGSRELVKRALDEGSKEVRVAAIACLGESPEDLSFLMEQARSKAKDVRGAALVALGKSAHGDAVSVLCKALAGADLELAVEPACASRDPEVLKTVLELARGQFDAVVTGKEKDAAKAGKQVERLLLLLECLRQRDDAATAEFLIACFGKREKLVTVKGSPCGQDVADRLASVMATGPQLAQSALVDAHQSLPPDELAQAFVAACRSRKPALVFEIFSPYLAAKSGLFKKKSDLASQKQAAIATVIIEQCGHRRYGRVTGPHEFDLIKNLDTRWLDLAVRQEHLVLVQALAVAGHAGVNRLLSHRFNEQLRQAKDTQELISILQTMVNVEHPEAADAVISAIRKHAAAAHGMALYWIAPLVSELPKTALPKLEALLPSLPEKAIDQLLDKVTQLKSRP